MGVTCACQKIESEEETISRIFSKMSLKEIETKSAYNEFLKCITKDNGCLDYFVFKNYIQKITGENSYRHAQCEYFENLRKKDKSQVNIKRIGSIIIFMSKGTKHSKVETLCEHYKTFYEDLNELTVKSFINDLVEINTEECVNSFKEYLGYDGVKNIIKVYINKRKKNLRNLIYLNYEGVRLKYHNIRKNISIKNFNIDTEDKLNTSIDMDNNRSNQLPSSNEKYHKSQNELIRTYSFKDENFETNDDKLLKEFIELSFDQMTGEYIRNWMYDDFLKEKSYENVCI